MIRCDGLAGLRRHRSLTQVEMGERLAKPQSVVSRLERQSDWHLSTLRSYVEAAGGRLVILVRHPDGHNVEVDL